MTAGALPPAALLVGGLGTRIRSVGGAVPKVLLPVEGRPFIAHLLRFLADQGVPEAVLCLGHAAEEVWDAAQTHRPEGMRLVASRETGPLGTGGALRLALAHLPGTFFLVNGDTYLEAALDRLLRFHREHEAEVTLTLVRSEKAAEKGTVRVDPRGRVLSFSEKISEGTGLINAGIYVLESRVMATVPEGTAVSLEREIIPGLLAAGGRVMALREDAPFVDIGLPEDYIAVRDRLPRAGGRR